jgi:hypothetical protein
MKAKLTDRLIRTRKPPAAGRLIITDTVVLGLSLRINAASTKNPDGLRHLANGSADSSCFRLVL